VGHIKETEILTCGMDGHR